MVMWKTIRLSHPDPDLLTALVVAVANWEGLKQYCTTTSVEIGMSIEGNTYLERFVITISGAS